MWIYTHAGLKPKSLSLDPSCNRVLEHREDGGRGADAQGWLAGSVRLSGAPGRAGGRAGRRRRLRCACAELGFSRDEPVTEGGRSVPT